MKLVIAIINEQIAGGLVEALTHKGIKVTRLNSTGGWLRRGNATIISGISDDEEKTVLKIIKDYSQKKQLQDIEKGEGKISKEGLVTVFVLPIEKMMQF